MRYLKSIIKTESGKEYYSPSTPIPDGVSEEELGQSISEVVGIYLEKGFSREFKGVNSTEYIIVPASKITEITIKVTNE